MIQGKSVQVGTVHCRLKHHTESILNKKNPPTNTINGNKST